MPRVLKILVLHSVLQKTVRHTCLTGFWVFLGLSICQDLNIQRSWICQGCTWFCVNCILKILSIFNVLSSEYAKVLNMLNLRDLNKILHRVYLTGFWIYHGFKICQGSEYIRVLNMSGFIKKTLHHIDTWQGIDYSSGSSYTRVLNMPGLHKVLKKCCFKDAWQDSKYSSGTENATILNMPGLRKVLNKTFHYRYLIIACIRNLNMQEFHRVCWRGS